MRYIIGLLFLILLTSACHKQNSEHSRVLTINGFELYQNLGSPGILSEKEFSRRGVGTITLIYGKDLHSKDGLYFTPEKLESALRRLVPEGLDQHMIVLDWEGPRMKQIVNGAIKKTDDYKAAKEELLKAYRLTDQTCL